MKKEPIILEWTEQGKKHKKEINRQEFFDVMESIKNAFSDDNTFSTMFTNIIPELISISINKDRNNQKDVPSIHYVTVGEEKEVDIIRYHKVIWSILDRYSTEE